MQLNPSAAESVLFVHAHPDDESISTGGTIALLVDRGASVTVVTCTRGELGEVIPEGLRRLQGDPAGLAAHREGELADALQALGVSDHRFLGAAGARAAGLPPRRYTDSGMRWGAHGAEALDRLGEDSLSAAPLGEVVADLLTVIEDVRPTAVVSYDAAGGYGHPDHVRAQEASRRAAEAAGLPFYAIEPAPAAGQLEIDVSSVVGRKTDALRAHRTQVTVDGSSFALSSGPRRPIETVERFRRERGVVQDPLVWRDQGLGLHLLVWILALVAGGAIGAISAVDHQYAWTVFGAAVPIGAIVSLAIIAALLAGLRLIFGGRAVTTLAALGILVVIGLLSTASDGGSVLIPANLAGYLLTYGSVVITLVALAWPKAGTFSRDKIVPRPEPKGTPSP
ncbi:MAG TPA: PIG-L family deacetylase [Lacisediminihabitans sp.]|uniref:PIG-L family deacetylase n=1 Tax=Lacisediminihabitans sp. TaxID=2787631 RepID=UPI002ED85459